MSGAIPLPIVNLETATFECTFGRGCEGTCCKNSRPGLHPHERQRIDDNLYKFLPHLRPAARAEIERRGYLTRRTRNGLPLVGVKDGWCLFFHQGCVLHQVGAAEGDKFRYKPLCCSLFPLLRDFDGQWYIRQSNEPWEEWKDLFCLDPCNSSTPAAVSLCEEIAHAAKIEAAGYPGGNGAAPAADETTP